MDSEYRKQQCWFHCHHVLHNISILPETVNLENHSSLTWFDTSPNDPNNVVCCPCFSCGMYRHFGFSINSKKIIIKRCLGCENRHELKLFEKPETVYLSQDKPINTIQITTKHVMSRWATSPRYGKESKKRCWHFVSHFMKRMEGPK